MSLIADALKRAQEQRTAGQGEDKARRMLRAAGPLRVETGKGARLTRPLALAAAAVVLGAGALVASVVMAPEVKPASARVPVEPKSGPLAAGGVTTGGEAPRTESIVEAGPGGEAPLAYGPLSYDGVQDPRRADAAEVTGAAADRRQPSSTGHGGRGSEAKSGSRSESEFRSEDPPSQASPAPSDPTVARPESAEVPAWTQAGEPASFRISILGGATDRSAEQYVADALAAHRAGELQRAVSLYRSAIELRPRDAELWNNLGTVYRGLSMRDEGLAAFRLAVEVEPSYAPAWSNLGLLLDELGREGAALEAFREALRRDPDNLGAKVNLANKYHALGIPADAARLLREVLRADPSLPEAHYALARVQEEEGELEEAVRHYRLFLELGRGQFGALEERVAAHLVGLAGGAR